MKIKPFFYCLLIALLSTSCITTNVKLKNPDVIKNESIAGYKYVYITPTKDFITLKSNVSSKDNSDVGYIKSESVNQYNLISGFLMKKGYIIIPELSEEKRSSTMIVSCGISNMRKANYALTTILIPEMTIQLLSAQTMEVLSISTAEGFSHVDDSIEERQVAIMNALNALFNE